MIHIEIIFKGFLEWLFGLFLEIVEYIANSLISVFNMDMDYFSSVMPVTEDIFKVITGIGWALLFGNLIFQAMKSMLSGLGFEADDPKVLFARTFIFSLLLLFSRQICEVGLSITHRAINFLQMTDSISIQIPDENMLELGAAWLLLIIVGFFIMVQIVRFFFEVGERYVVLAVLTLLSPLAFSMGGSRSTAGIFNGWCRMYGSMCVMMIFNVVFLKLIVAALGYMPAADGLLAWVILVIALCRTARKIDSIITKIGLNPAITGEGIGAMLILNNAVSAISKVRKFANASNTARYTERTGFRTSEGFSKSGGSAKDNRQKNSGSQSTGRTGASCQSKTGGFNAAQNTGTAGKTGFYSAPKSSFDTHNASAARSNFSNFSNASNAANIGNYSTVKGQTSANGVNTGVSNISRPQGNVFESQSADGAVHNNASCKADNIQNGRFTQNVSQNKGISNLNAVNQKTAQIKNTPYSKAGNTSGLTDFKAKSGDIKQQTNAGGFAIKETGKANNINTSGIRNNTYTTAVPKKAESERKIAGATKSQIKMPQNNAVQFKYNLNNAKQFSSKIKSPAPPDADIRLKTIKGKDIDRQPELKDSTKGDEKTDEQPKQQE